MQFAIEHRDAGTQARAGVLHLAHGEVRTPAFVPLATKGTVKTLLPVEVAALGYDIVLGNTFHLMLEPGPEVVAAHGGLHGFMGWPGPIITDSGGFQVFSMGHGTVADEIKGRASQGAGARGRDPRDHGGGRALPLLHRRGGRFLSPEGSMEVQAALGSDIALAFDECTPFHVSRATTPPPRPSAPTAGCTGAWTGTPSTARPARPSTGSSRAACTRTCAAASAQAVAASGCEGIAIGGSLGKDKAQMHEVVGWATQELPEDRPRHLLGIGEIDDLIRGVELGIDTFDCAMPTRIARHGMALVPEPEARWRVNLLNGRFRDDLEPILAGCSCPACAGGMSRVLPAPPRPPARADRAAPAHAAQPHVRGRGDGAAPRRRRRRHARGSGGGAA